MSNLARLAEGATPMVMTEAMACGTPVIHPAQRIGAGRWPTARPASSLSRSRWPRRSIGWVRWNRGHCPRQVPPPRPSTSKSAGHQLRHPLHHHRAVAAASTNRRRVRVVSRLSATGRRLGQSKEGIAPTARRDAGRGHPGPKKHHAQHPREDLHAPHPPTVGRRRAGTGRRDRQQRSPPGEPTAISTPPAGQPTSPTTAPGDRRPPPPPPLRGSPTAPVRPPRRWPPPAPSWPASSA